ncbi:MAG: multiubiquitin domain-containing protein [Opitutaceae bacterium]|nr:multiubiquitin domain-containing protein [Opitutaceae bacterium]
MNSSKTPSPSDDIIDLEEYAKAGKPVPKAKRYKFRVGKETFTTDQEKLTGREILTITGKVPPENWLLTMKKGKGTVTIELKDVVDLTEPGVERFMVMPKDQTEGEEPALRRNAVLPSEDVEGLDTLGLPWETIVEGGAMWLLVHRYPLPHGYRVETTAVAIRISQNYPVEQLDMVYFFPALVRSDGKAIAATESTQLLDGQSFQRWSRHYTPQNPWVPGEFSVLTHLSLVRHWLEREFPKAA